MICVLLFWRRQKGLLGVDLQRQLGYSSADYASCLVSTIVDEAQTMVIAI
jgi:hypothetical protein